MLTIFIGRIRASFRFDRKKVVAFSTLRNLGLLGFALSKGLIGLAFFHLVVHGIRKALLFICVGKNMKKKKIIFKIYENFLKNFLKKFSKNFVEFEE